MIRRPPRSTLSSSSAASDVYKRQSVHFLERDQVSDRRDHAPDLGAVLLDDGVRDPLEPKRTQRLPLVLLPADARADLRDLEARHHAPAPARARSMAAGATSSIGRPRPPCLFIHISEP